MIPLRSLVLLSVVWLCAGCASRPALVQPPAAAAVPAQESGPGRGRALLADGAVYEGDFKDGLMDGQGRLVWPNGERYEGGFRRGVMHGQGRYFPPGGGEVVEGRWERGVFVSPPPARVNEAGELALVPELVLFRQYPLLMGRLRRIAPSRPGQTELYAIVFGADGDQDVFTKEAVYVQRLLARRYAGAGHSLLLVNHRRTLQDTPLASAGNLRQALKVMARRMDVEEDILLLYFTGHGSRRHELQVRMEGLPLVDISPPLLKTLLAEAGIKWKVVIISSCYSGGFVDELRDDYTMVITSAHAERTSFGCSDDADMTYFGRAFFQQALPRSDSFRAAFELARRLVGSREKAEGFTPSLPQFHATPGIEAMLARWRAALREEGAAGSGKQAPP